MSIVDVGRYQVLYYTLQKIMKEKIPTNVLQNML